MEKKFRLPIEFAKKWTSALRGGEYNQTIGTLIRRIKDSDNDNIEFFGFCCLGVAGHVCGHTKYTMGSNNYLKPSFKTEQYDVPLELISSNLENKLVRILSNMNDGISCSIYAELGLKEYNFRDLNKFMSILNCEVEKVYFTFNEIADFIEDNCEFYDTPLFSDEELIQD